MDDKGNEKNSEEENTDDEARELDHSKLSDSQEDEDTERDKEEKQNKRDSDSEESIIEVVFDSNGMKVVEPRHNRAILMPGLQLVLKAEELDEEEDEVENIDAEIEEEIIVAEEGDGK